MPVALPLDEPIRFLAVEWREAWEFDHPSVLLLPVFRYFTSGVGVETLVEDVAINLSVDLEFGRPIDPEPHAADQTEFDWRGWDRPQLRRKVEDALRGRKVTFGTDYWEILERTAIFFRDGKEINFRFETPLRRLRGSEQ